MEEVHVEEEDTTAVEEADIPEEVGLDPSLLEGVEIDLGLPEEGEAGEGLPGETEPAGPPVIARPPDLEIPPPPEAEDEGEEPVELETQ